MGTLRRIAALAPLLGSLGSLLAIARLLTAIPEVVAAAGSAPAAVIADSTEGGMGAGTGRGVVSLDLGAHNRDVRPGGLRLACHPDRTVFRRHSTGWGPRPSMPSRWPRSQRPERILILRLAHRPAG